MTDLLIFEDVNPNNIQPFRIAELFMTVDGPRTRMTNNSFQTKAAAEHFVKSHSKPDKQLECCKSQLELLRRFYDFAQAALTDKSAPGFGYPPGTLQELEALFGPMTHAKAAEAPDGPAKAEIPASERPALMTCEYCGAFEQSVNRASHCAPPFDVQPHRFTKPHPYLKEG